MPARPSGPALANRELLVLLDNAEHLPAAFPVFAGLLAEAPRVSLLVTSRVVLHLSGEHVYPVEPLPADAARALFHERARSVAPHLRLSEEDERAIAAICARLDGLPLAIELAAGRVRSLTPAELLERLEPRMPLLAGGPHDLPARQRTLRATLEWSYELLEASERRDLERAAVFAGGFGLEAAEVVCETTVDRLASLVDHNLLQHRRRHGVSRYTMLETIREYALELLDASSEADDVRRRHAAFFLEVARSANLNPGRFAAGGQHLAIANDEQDNIRAALGWLLAAGEIERGLELASAMDMFWTAHDAEEGIRWFSALLDHPGARDAPPALVAHCLRGLGSSQAIAGDTDAAARSVGGEPRRLRAPRRRSRPGGAAASRRVGCALERRPGTRSRTDRRELLTARQQQCGNRADVRAHGHDRRARGDRTRNWASSTAPQP